MMSLLSSYNNIIKLFLASSSLENFVRKLNYFVIERNQFYFFFLCLWNRFQVFSSNLHRIIFEITRREIIFSIIWTI